MMTKDQQPSKETTQITQDTQEKLPETPDVVTDQNISAKKRTGVINKMMAIPHCPHGNTPVRKMTLQQLNDVYEYSEKHTIDLILLSNVLERLIALSENHAGVKKYKLQFADTHFQMNHLEIAAIYYEDFRTLYPSSNEAQYASFKSVGCMFQLSLSADRDQTNTKKTIALAKEFIKEYPEHSLHQEALDILATCYERLYDHEVYVFNFYVKRKKFTAAGMRLTFITTTFDQLIPDLEKKVCDLTTQLDLAQNPVKVDKKTTMHKFLG